MPAFAAAGAEPPAPAPASEPWHWWDLRNSPFIPIPEIGTDPNSGTTIGILPIYLERDERDQIQQIIAPDLIIHPDLGYGGHFRIFSYPSKDREWAAVIGAKQRIERELDLVYSTGLTREQPWSNSAHLVYDRSATERFFGIGNGAVRGGETNYTREQVYADLTVSFNVSPALQVTLDERPRFVEVEPGILGPSSIALGFLGSDTELLNRLLVTYDTRDSPAIPTRGTALAAFVGFADRQLLSSMSYTLFGFDARHVAPLGDDGKFALVGHVAARYMPTASNAPFWTLSSIGGDRSVVSERQPLRGFGDDRFIDRNAFSASVELRSHVLDINVMSTALTFEAAPFIDAGQVFPRVSDSPVNRLHVAGGIGLRMIAAPFVVGYVDVGYGGEGVAVFSGIKYPF
jgi:surface antigen Omp85-like protein